MHYVCMRFTSTTVHNHTIYAFIYINEQGVIVCMEALRMIKESGIVPRRTIRAVLFVDEECRQTGAKAYFDSLKQKEELDRVFVCMETDLGAGPVIGFGCSAGDGGTAVVRDILAPMEVLNSYKKELTSSSSSSSCNIVNDEWQGYGES